MADMSDATEESMELLCSFVERIESLHSDREIKSRQIADIFKEAKSHGFLRKPLGLVIDIRREERKAGRKHDDIVSTYLRAQGVFNGTGQRDPRGASEFTKPSDSLWEE